MPSSKVLLNAKFKCAGGCVKLQVPISNTAAFERILRQFLNDPKSATTEVGAGYTYELSENLVSTPSDGIAPTRKLLDTLLQII